MGELMILWLLFIVNFRIQEQKLQAWQQKHFKWSVIKYVKIYNKVKEPGVNWCYWLSVVIWLQSVYCRKPSLQLSQFQNKSKQKNPNKQSKSTASSHILLEYNNCGGMLLSDECWRCSVLNVVAYDNINIKFLQVNTHV